MIITFQEFEQHKQDRAKWIGQAIAQYKRSDEYKTALDADQYEMQMNTTIMSFVKMVYDITGVAMPDFTATNNKLCSNFFHRFITQRNSYLLGNGVSFASKTEGTDENGETIITDKTKDTLGKEFDSAVFDAGFNALKHSVSYTFFNDGDYHVFPMTEFMPLPDADTGIIRAGMRFWSLDWNRSPITVDLYEEDGYSRYRTKEKKYGLGALELVEEKKPYKEIVQITEADGEEVIGGENYGSLPIVPCYGCKNKISALVGMKANIDAYDLIKSGFANDETDVAQIYWLINNAAGMNEDDIRRFRDRLLLQHVAVVDTDNSSIDAHSQEVPFQSREACLNRIENDLYRDFGALDVTKIATGQSKTATEIRAAYSSLDEETDNFETQVTKYIKQILKLIGIEDEPVYKRNRICNLKEETEMVMLAANELDKRTLLTKLPFITPDEVDGILARTVRDDREAFETEV